MVRTRLERAGSVLLRNVQRQVRLPAGLATDTRRMLDAAVPWGSRYAVAVVAADNDYVRALNRRYRKVDRPTDVLSFPVFPELRPGQEPTLLAPTAAFRNLGDIVLGMPYVQRQCEQHGWDLRERVRLLLAHGICHLLGHRHDTDGEHAKMRRHEDVLLAAIGARLPPPGCGDDDGPGDDGDNRDRPL